MSARAFVLAARVVGAAALALAATLLSGCAGGSATAAAPAAAGTAPAAAQGSTLGPPVPSSTLGDSRGCVSVQALMSHLGAATAGWSPTLKPFDPIVAARIQDLSVNLTMQLPSADAPELRQAIVANARAFGLLARAMHGKNKQAVVQAVDGTRTAYRPLKQLCSFE